MELIEEVKELLIETEKVLKGSARRLFMARTVHALGERGQRLAEQELGWNRGTIRKGQRELESGIICLDVYSLRGRKCSEEHLPNLLKDITFLGYLDYPFKNKRFGHGSLTHFSCLQRLIFSKFLVF